MASNYAKLNEDNIVLHVINLDNGLDINPETNEVDHEYAANYLTNLYGGKWVNTSVILSQKFVDEDYVDQTDDEYRRSAQNGDRYDEELDAFISPQPFPSWVLDSKYRWIPPVPMPDFSGLADQTYYTWDEDAYQADNTQGWVLKHHAQVKLESLGLTVDDLRVILNL